jgi:hypothetical protein
MGDLFQNCCGIIQDTIILETKHRESLGFQIGIASLIMLLLVERVMHWPVTFNDELRFGAKEVADVFPKLVLTAKLRTAKLPIPKELPQEGLGIGLVLPHFPRALDQSSEIKTAPIMRIPLAPWERGQG